MNRQFFCFVALLLFTTLPGCKKFLNIKPLDRLAGNAFWQSRGDVESYVSNIYGQFRDKIQSTSFIPGAGELRSGMLKMSENTNTSARRYIDLLGQNLVKEVMPEGEVWNQWGFNFPSMTRWKEFYRVIQSANVCVFELSKRTIPGLASSDVKRYQAEAVFMRCLTYLFMVRVWGDVPYYTEAYESQALGREDMRKVISNCIADLSTVKDDLPWTYSDPAFRAVRASRGSAIALLMYMNLWNAGFDKANKQAYYTKTAELGKELIESGVHHLMPLKDFNILFKGRSPEGLLEVAQSSNYGETLSAVSPFSDLVLRYPNKRPLAGHEVSYGYFRAEFLRLLYPEGQTDLRKDYWFDQYMYSNSGMFQFLKFTNIYAIGEQDVNPDDNVIIFRYAGAILWTAEALAELGKDGEAKTALNLVRERAGTQVYNGPGGPALKEAIFIEEAKELMGEGLYYYDLLRTGRILDSKWCNKPLTSDQFNRGGWTWPLDASVQNNNAKIKLNEYWIQ